MAPQTIDAAGYRQGQREQWNSAAAGWRRWSPLIDGGTSHISQRLVDLAGVGPGSRVLDVAAGYGEPSLTAARRVGPEGHVVASDISPGMLAYGRERAEAAGVSNLEFVESDASSLDFAEATFDAALSRWGIIFEPDGEGAAARVRTLLKPGGRMAISSWGLPDEVPMLGLPMRVAMQRLNVPPPPPGTPGPLSRPTPEALGGLLTAAGFSDVDVTLDDVTLEWASPEEFATFIKDIAPPITMLLEPHPEAVRKETWAAITTAVRDLAGDGPVRLSNKVLLAAGRA